MLGFAMTGTHRSTEESRPVSRDVLAFSLGWGGDRSAKALRESDGAQSEADQQHRSERQANPSGRLNVLHGLNHRTPGTLIGRHPPKSDEIAKLLTRCIINIE
jgi:hypothetical protein